MKQTVRTLQHQLDVTNQIVTVESALTVPRSFKKLTLSEHIKLYPESSETITALLKFLPGLATAFGIRAQPLDVVLIAPRKSFVYLGHKYHASWEKQKFSYLKKGTQVMQLLLIFSYWNGTQVNAFGRVMSIQYDDVLSSIFLLQDT